MRIPALAVGAVLTGLVTCATAGAGPLPGPLHESTVAVVVPAGVRSVVVDLDAGDVTMSAGASHGTAHKRWNLQEPKLTTSFHNGTLQLQGRCSENEVDAGVVYVGAPVNECGIDLTLSVPAGVAVNVIGDHVSLTGLQGGVRVHALDGVALTRLGPGPVDAASDTSTVSLRSSQPARVKLAANGGVVVTDVVTGGLDTRSASSTASLARVTAKTLSADANGRVSLTQVRASVADLRSSSSSLSLSEVKVVGALSGSANGAVSLAQVTAATANVISDSSSVTISSTRLLRRLSVAGNGSVRVDHTTAGAADLRSYASSLDVSTSPLTAFVGSANGAVNVSLPRVPDHVQLTSDSSSLTLAVPRASYAVTAHSGTGSVDLNGIVIDDRAPRSLDLSANGNISVN